MLHHSTMTGRLWLSNGRLSTVLHHIADVGGLVNGARNRSTSGQKESREVQEQVGLLVIVM
jgi:hypothetical protein